MAQIQKAPISKLSTATLITYGKSIESKIDSLNITKTDFKPHYDSFKSSLTVLGEVNFRISINILTKQLNQIGKERGKIRSSIFNIIYANQNHYDNEIQEAAKRLANLIDSFSGIALKSYFQQTTLLESLIKTATSDVYKEDVKKLNLTEWFAHLKQKNNDYLSVKNSTIDQKASNNALTTITEARKIFTNDYYNLVLRINSLANVNGEDVYFELFTFWNALIDDLRINISLRQGSGKGGKPAGNTSNKPDPNSGPVNNDNDKPIID